MLVEREKERLSGGRYVGRCCGLVLAAIGRLAMRLKVEASSDCRLRFLVVALAESGKAVPALAKIWLKTLPFTQGTMFAGKWTPQSNRPGKPT